MFIHVNCHFEVSSFHCGQGKLHDLTNFPKNVSPYIVGLKYDLTLYAMCSIVNNSKILPLNCNPFTHICSYSAVIPELNPVLMIEKKPIIASISQRFRIILQID